MHFLEWFGCTGLIMADELSLDIKKSKSYFGVIPSIDFDSGQYFLFLSLASEEELQQDIIYRETLHKINPPDYSRWKLK